MKAFWNLVRQAFAYRVTIFLSFICSLLVGLLWGANIGTLYPVIEVVFRGESLVQSVHRSIEEGQRHIAQLERERDELESKLALAPGPDPQLETSRLACQSRIEAENRALETWASLEPWAANYLPTDPMTTLLVVMSALVCATVLKGAFISLNEILVARVTLRTMFDLRKRFYRRAMHWDLATFTEDRSSRLMSRFTHDLTRIGEGLQTVFGRALHEPIKIAVCLGGAAFLCWRLLLISLIFAPLGFLVMRFISQASRRNAEDEMSAMADVYAHLAESFRGIKAVMAFSRGQNERKKFHGLAKTLLRRRMHAAAWRSLIKPTGEILSTSVVSIAVIIGAYLVLNRETQIMGITICTQPLTATTLMVFYGFLLGASEPMKKLSGISVQLIRTAAAAQRVEKLMSRKPDILNPENPLPIPTNANRILVDNLTFRYRQGENVLHKISLEIEVGENVVLVGPNGCGKSTLLNLIARFYDPKNGSIRFDDTDIRDFRVEEWRRQISLVPQEGVLFDDSVMNNIRYGLQNATDEQVIEAAKQARAHEFITTRLTDGYETVIGEDGCMLSGGQRQRLALARACLRNAPIWILDEATSNVDAATVEEFRDILGEHLRNRTAIIVSHRTSDLVLADRIVVMSAGRIVDVGQHQELLQRCEYYQQLHGIPISAAA